MGRGTKLSQRWIKDLGRKAANFPKNGVKGGVFCKKVAKGQPQPASILTLFEATFRFHRAGRAGFVYKASLRQLTSSPGHNICQQPALLGRNNTQFRHIRGICRSIFRLLLFSCLVDGRRRCVS
jgi:hypothetical protein